MTGEKGKQLASGKNRCELCDIIRRHRQRGVERGKGGAGKSWVRGRKLSGS